jgi:hypothetical protein
MGDRGAAEQFLVQNRAIENKRVTVVIPVEMALFQHPHRHLI